MTEPIWIDERDAMALHDRLLALHGGAAGLRDEGFLLSALARPTQHFAYGAETETVQLTAIYTGGVVKIHPFIDGNKRTGFVLGILFLELNGFMFTASEADAAQAVLALASGGLDEVEYAAFLTANSRRA